MTPGPKVTYPNLADVLRFASGAAICNTSGPCARTPPPSRRGKCGPAGRQGAGRRSTGRGDQARAFPASVPSAHGVGFEPEAARAAKRPNPTLSGHYEPKGRAVPTPPASAPSSPAGWDSSPKRREPRSDRSPLSPPPVSAPSYARRGDSSPKRREPRSDRIPLSPAITSPRGEPCLRPPQAHRARPRGGIRARSGESREATESHSLRHYEPRGRVVAERVSTDFRFPATSEVVPPIPAKKHYRKRLPRTGHLPSSVDFRCHPENNW